MQEKHSLIELASTMNRYIQALENMQGEINDAQENELATVETMLLQKADNCNLVLTKLQNEAEFYLAEAKRLQSYAKTIENAHDRLKQMILNAVQMSGPIQGDTVVFKTRKNPPSVVVDDESLIPKDYFETTIVQKLDKTRLKEDLKAGLPVTGARLETKESLLIGRPTK